MLPSGSLKKATGVAACTCHPSAGQARDRRVPGACLLPRIIGEQVLVRDPVSKKKKWMAPQE